MNTLTQAQAERLIFLIEECSEVIQEATKILRFGFDSYHPDDPTKETNRERLRRELTDVMACIALLEDKGDILEWMYDELKTSIDKKLKRARFQHHDIFDSRSA